MAETTADVRRDIELTRERMSTTIEQLENKLNVGNVIRDHPWPSLALAAGAGFLLASSRADAKTAAAAVKATGGASSKLGSLLDDAAARLIGGVSDTLSQHVDGWVSELKGALGATASAAASRTSRSAEPSLGESLVTGDGTARGATRQYVNVTRPLPDAGTGTTLP